MASSHSAQFHPVNLAWRTKLIAAQIPSSFDKGQLYVPWEDMERITAPKAIGKAELKLLGVEGLDKYAKLVKARVRILCTLIYSHLTHKFLNFCDYPRCHDSGLPVERRIENGVITVTGRTLVAEVLSGWEQSEIYDFYDSQWRFNAPRLHMDYWGRTDESLNQAYHARTILPFDSESMPKTTPFSRVWKVKVHPSHFDFKVVWDDCRPPTNGFIALKESVIDVNGLRVQPPVQEALNERRIYEQLSPPARLLNVDSDLEDYRSHLTDLRMAFRRENSYYMIFQWAEGGSLGNFWHEKDAKEFTATEVQQWMESNIIGLLGAVYLLHKIGCSHGDLKPDNILVFGEPENPEQQNYSYRFDWASSLAPDVSLPRELGILKITDFGTARESSNATIARTRDANALTGAQRYAPPEFDRNELEHDSPRSRLYDVWSMGCILLEFIIWACSGRDSVRRFSSRLEEPYPGRFWTYGDNKQKILHPAVRHQFRKLKRCLEDTGTNNEWLNEGLKEYLLRLLEVVRTEMLVINVDKTIPATPRQFEDSCTDDKGRSSEGTENTYRASAETLHMEFSWAGLNKPARRLFHG